MLLTTPAGFRQQHPWDRDFFALATAVIWAVILRGFVPAIIDHLRTGGPAYPAIIHVHAVVFVGWLVLLSAQVSLIRRHRYDVHRRLGTAGGALAVAMVVLGPWAGIAAEQAHFGTPLSDPPFLSVELIEMIVFVPQVAAALWLRRDGSAHKRLMLLATLFLTTAGFGRWTFESLSARLGDGFVPFLLAFFGPTALLVLGVGLYDLVTRHRLHPAYAYGAALGVAGQILAAWLYVSPAWKAVSLTIIGH